MRYTGKCVLDLPTRSTCVAQLLPYFSDVDVLAQPKQLGVYNATPAVVTERAITSRSPSHLSHASAGYMSSNPATPASNGGAWPVSNSTTSHSSKPISPPWKDIPPPTIPAPAPPQTNVAPSAHTKPQTSAHTKPQTPHQRARRPSDSQSVSRSRSRAFSADTSYQPQQHTKSTTQSRSQPRSNSVSSVSECADPELVAYWPSEATLRAPPMQKLLRGFSVLVWDQVRYRFSRCWCAVRLFVLA